MNIKEARQYVRNFIKENGLRGKVKYTSTICSGFDFIFHFNGDIKYYDTFRNGLKKLNYSDPENDIMTDYFGCHNTLLTFNGRCL